MGFQTAFMPRPRSSGKPKMPVVPIERVITEDQLHKQVVEYLGRALPSHRWRFHHSPNGGPDKAWIGKNKALGTHPGWPDIEIIGSDASGQFRVVFIELKAVNGSLSREQKELHAFIVANNGRVHVARSLDQVIAILEVEGIKKPRVAP